MICTVDTSEFLGLIDSVLLNDQIQATTVYKNDVGPSIIEQLNKNHVEVSQAMIRTVDTSEFLGLNDAVLLNDQIQATNVCKNDVDLNIIEQLKKNHVEVSQEMIHTVDTSEFLGMIDPVLLNDHEAVVSQAMMGTVDTSEFLGLIDSVLLNN